MVESTPRCALPDCDQPLESLPDGRSQRKYCSPEHSLEARRLRQQARVGTATPADDVADPEEAAAEEAATEEAVTGTATPAVDLPGTESVPWDDEHDGGKPRDAKPRDEKRGRLRKALVAAGLVVLLGTGGLAAIVGGDPPDAVPVVNSAAGGSGSANIADRPVVADRKAPLPVPAPPVELTASPANGEVRLCWKAAAHADAYIMYHRDTTAGGEWFRMPYPVVDGLCWTAKQLWNNHVYEFRIAGSNSSGESGFSNTVAAKPEAPKAGVPPRLTASPGDGQVRLCWKAAAHADAYIMYHRDTTAGGEWFRMPYPVVDGLCWTAKQLWNNHAYEFRIAGSNSSGESGFSNIVSAVPARPKPAAATGLTGTPGNGRAELCWRPAAGADAYVLYYRNVTEGQDWVVMPYPITDRCYVAQLMKNGNVYEFRIKASNSAGEADAFSNTVNVIPRP